MKLYYLLLYFILRTIWSNMKMEEKENPFPMHTWLCGVLEFFLNEFYRIYIICRIFFAKKCVPQRHEDTGNSEDL